MSEQQRLAAHAARTDAARRHLDEHFSSDGRRDGLYPGAARGDDEAPSGRPVQPSSQPQPASGAMDHGGLRGVKP